jgi:large subunit ribosomal protein L9
MQVILLDKVANLGNLGDIVKVKDGFARNFLIPTRLARRATESNKAEFAAKLTQKAGVDGRLFGSVTNQDIADELNKQGYKIVKAQVRMPNGPIKVTGDNTVAISLHTDVVSEITVTVYGETA